MYREKSFTENKHVMLVKYEPVARGQCARLNKLC